MRRSAQFCLVWLALISVLMLLVYESRNHFSSELIKQKRQHNSAQRNWNVFYGQHFGYYGGIFRYQRDLKRIKKLIEPGHIVLSDLATSYYAAASLPIYARNVHRHQGRSQALSWKALLDEKHACKLYKEGSYLAFKQFISEERVSSAADELPKFKYVLVNKDLYNKNVRLDCLWNGRAAFMDAIVKVSSLVFEGEFLKLYKISEPLSTASP